MNNFEKTFDNDVEIVYNCIEIGGLDMIISKTVEYISIKTQVSKKSMAEKLGITIPLFSRHCNTGILSGDDFLSVLGYCDLAPEFYYLKDDTVINSEKDDPADILNNALKKVYGTKNKLIGLGGMTEIQTYHRRCKKTKLKAEELFNCLVELGFGLRIRSKTTGYYIIWSESKEIRQKVSGVTYNTRLLMPISRSGEDGGDWMNAELFSTKEGTFIIAVYGDTGDKLMLCSGSEAEKFVQRNGNKALDFLKL